MGISVELWRARIGLFSGGRGSRPHSKAPSTKQQPLHFSDTVGTTAKVVQGGLLLLYILKFLSSQDKTEFLKRTRNVGLLVVSIAVLLHSLAHLLLLAGDVESNPGPQMDETLTLDDLNEAHTKLHDSRNRWFEIGQALHVDDITLDSIRKQCANDDSACLREVLAHRLKSGPPLTWKELLNSQCGLGEHSRTIGQLERSLSTSLHGSSAQPVSTVLQGLLDKYQLGPSQVDCQIQQIDTPFLAAYFDNVEFYVDLMELTTGEKTDVEGAKTNHLAVIKCLNIWKRKNPAQATFRTLLEMLIKLRKEEIADQICQYMKDPMRRTLLNNTTTTQSLKSGTWTEDLLNSLPTQSSSKQESSDTHDYFEESSIPGGCTLSSTKSLHDSLERSDKHQPNHPAELADDRDISSGDESFHSATDNRDIFVCPYCKECSPQQFFSEEGCPKKTRSIETTTLFPYLDVTGLDDEDVIDLEERLISDTREVRTKFYNFSLCIRESIEQLDTLDNLRDCILGAVVLLKDQDVSALDTEHKGLVLAANSLAKIFSILRVYDYISFLNYQIIELLIRRYGTADDHKLLEQYLADLKTFCERNVFEVPLSAFSSHRSRKTAKVFALKCTKPPTLTLQGVQAMQNNVAEILGLEFNALQLCSVKKGCVELHFLVSAAVAEHIFPLSPSQQSALSEIGARLLLSEEEKEKEMVKDANVDILTPKVSVYKQKQQVPSTDYGEPPTVNDGEPPTSEELYLHPEMSLEEKAEVLQNTFYFELGLMKLTD